MCAKINVKRADYSQYRNLSSTACFQSWSIICSFMKISQNSIKVLIKEGKIEGEDEDFTKKVVFKDILLSQS